MVQDKKLAGPDIKESIKEIVLDKKEAIKEIIQDKKVQSMHVAEKETTSKVASVSQQVQEVKDDAQFVKAQKEIKNHI